MIPAVPEFAELDALLLKLDDESMDLDDVDRLNELLTQPAARDRYRLFIAICGTLSWDHRLPQNDSVILEPILEPVLEPIPEQIPTPVARPVRAQSPSIPKPSRPPSTRLQPVAYATVAAAIVVLLIAGAKLLYPSALIPQTQPVIAKTLPALKQDILEATVDAVWDDALGAMPQGEVLTSQPLTLKSGLARLRLRNDVTMIVEGPAQFQFVSPGLMLLNIGKIAVKVPAAARGFTVQTASARVVDLGTEFGVAARRDGSTHAEVFYGTIETHALRAFNTAPATLKLVRGEAVEMAMDSKVVKWGNIMPEDFVQDLAQVRSQIPLHNTGIGLEIGGADQHWQITEKSFDAAYRPQPAVVKDYDELNYVNDPLRSQWISTTPEMRTVDPVGYYTFQTHIDLTGFDPDTALIRAYVLADDAVADVRINGISMGLTIPVRPDADRAVGNMVLRGAFKAGINEIAFIVYNRPNTIVRNPVMLRVEMNGAAARATESSATEN